MKVKSLLAFVAFLTAVSNVYADYVEKVNKWHKKRIERLKDPEGWLSLIGLEWLEGKKLSIGSDTTSDIVVNSSHFPRKAGYIMREDDRWFFVPFKDILAYCKGERVTNKIELKDDSSGNPTKIEIGTVVFYLIKRGNKVGVRIKDKNAKLLREFKGIDRFPVDKKWKVRAKIEKIEDETFIDTVVGVKEKVRVVGKALFKLGGKEYSLLVFNSDSYWTIFGDLTNGVESYGGGRFVPVEKVSDNEVIIDFNKAYNPPCVFTPYSTCPLPPTQNKLPIHVRAGEKVWKLSREE